MSGIKGTTTSDAGSINDRHDAVREAAICNKGEDAMGDQLRPERS